jgi:O-antigen ligase
MNIVFSKTNLMSESAQERFVGAGLEESGRMAMWAEGLSLIAKRPLQGYGLCNSPYARKGKGKQYALHNNFIAVGADLGLVGLALFIAILLVLFAQLRRISDPQLKWLGMAMFFAAVVTGVTAINYVMKDFWYALQVSLCTAVISYRLKNEDEKNGKQ